MRILLISLSNIGDVILTTPVLEALARRWPAAAITVIAGPRAAPLFERDPRVAAVIPYDKTAPVIEKLRLLWRLYRVRFDRVVNLRHGVLPRAGGHRVAQHLAVIRRMGIPADGIEPSLVVGPEDERAVDQWLSPLILPSPRWGEGTDEGNHTTPSPPRGEGTGEGKRPPLVAIAPGARSHLKRWPAAGFAAVCDAMIQEFGAQIVLVGDADDRPIAEAVIAALRPSPRSSPPTGERMTGEGGESGMRGRVVNLTGRTTLRQLAALFRRASLVLTNDSACLHLAGAVRTPVVAVFGPTDPVKYGPRGPRDAVVRLGQVCSPCEQALSPYGHECLQTLPARDVLAAVRTVLGATVLSLSPMGRGNG
ncbi:MAG: glycosyltransferase family 9 protein [Candidatus Omnitrophica bacterium]|nr:glycosyltransferase family 9 protein [Candidatus Omnitrophota bacterium]